MPVMNGLLAVAAVAGATLFTNSAVAQDCSRLLDIAELGFIPNPNDITFGINNQHEAVGAYMVDQKKHAFLWLPAAVLNAKRR